MLNDKDFDNKNNQDSNMPEKQLFSHSDKREELLSHSLPESDKPIFPDDEALSAFEVSDFSSNDKKKQKAFDKTKAVTENADDLIEKKKQSTSADSIIDDKKNERSVDTLIEQRKSDRSVDGLIEQKASDRKIDGKENQKVPGLEDRPENPLPVTFENAETTSKQKKQKTGQEPVDKTNDSADQTEAGIKDDRPVDHIKLESFEKSETQEKSRADALDTADGLDDAGKDRILSKTDKVKLKAAEEAAVLVQEQTKDLFGYEDNDADGKSAAQVIHKAEEDNKNKTKNTVETTAKVVAAVAVTVISEGAAAPAAKAEMAEAGSATSAAGSAGAETVASGEKAVSTARAAKAFKEEESRKASLLNRLREETALDEQTLKKRQQNEQSVEIIKGEMRKESLAAELSKDTGADLRKQSIIGNIAGFSFAPVLALRLAMLFSKLPIILTPIALILMLAFILCCSFFMIIGTLRVSLTTNLSVVPEDRTVYTVVRTLPNTWENAATNQAQILVKEYEANNEPVDLVFSLGSPHVYESVAIWYARRTYEAPKEAASGVWADYIEMSETLSGLKQDDANWSHKQDDAYKGEFAIKKLAEKKNDDKLDKYKMPMSDLLSLYTISQEVNFTMLSVETKPEAGRWVTEMDEEGNAVGGYYEPVNHNYITTWSEFSGVEKYYSDAGLSQDIIKLAEECIAGNNDGFNYLWDYLTRRMGTPESQFRYLPVDLAIDLWGDFGRRTPASKWNKNVYNALNDVYGTKGSHPNTVMATALNQYKKQGTGAFNRNKHDEKDTLAEIFGKNNKKAFEARMGKLPSGVSWTGTTWNQYINAITGAGKSNSAWCAAFVSGMAQHGTIGYFETEYSWYLNSGLKINSISDSGYAGSFITTAEAGAQKKKAAWKSLTAEQFANACYQSKAWTRAYMIGFQVLGRNFGVVDCGGGRYAVIYKASNGKFSSALKALGMDEIPADKITWIGTPPEKLKGKTLTVSSLEEMIPKATDAVKDGWWRAVESDTQNNDSPLWTSFPHNLFAVNRIKNNNGLAGLRLSTDHYFVSLTNNKSKYASSNTNLINYMTNGTVGAAPSKNSATYTVYLDVSNYADKVDNKTFEPAEIKKLQKDIKSGNGKYNKFVKNHITYQLPNGIKIPFIAISVPRKTTEWNYGKISFSKDGNYSSAKTLNPNITYKHTKGYYSPLFKSIESDAGYSWSINQTDAKAEFWRLCWALGLNYDNSKSNIGYNLLKEIPQRRLQYFQYQQRGCTQMAAFYRSKGWLYDYMSSKDSFVPNDGDLILYYNKNGNHYSTTNYSHVGIVIGTTKKDKNGVYSILTIEGNTSNTVFLCIHKNTDLYNKSSGRSIVSFACLPY